MLTIKTDEIIKITEDGSYLRFEISGYKQGTIDNSELADWDCGEPSCFETVKAFLIVDGKVEIELSEEQSEKAFSVYEAEFYDEMCRINKKIADDYNTDFIVQRYEENLQMKREG